MLATIVTVSTLAIYLWFLSCSSYKIVWKGVDLEDDDEEDAASPDCNLTAKKAESLALIVARLLDGKLKTDNSALKDLMVLQMISTDAISQKLLALEAKSAPSDTQLSKPHSPLLVLANRQIAQLEELADINKLAHEEEIQRLKHEHIADLDACRAKKDSKLADHSQRLQKHIRNSFTTMNNAMSDRYQTEHNLKQWRECARLLDDHLVPHLQYSLAFAAANANTCRVQLGEAEKVAVQLRTDIDGRMAPFARALHEEEPKARAAMERFLCNPIVTGTFTAQPNILTEEAVLRETSRISAMNAKWYHDIPLDSVPSHPYHGKPDIEDLDYFAPPPATYPQANHRENIIPATTEPSADPSVNEGAYPDVAPTDSSSTSHNSAENGSESHSPWATESRLGSHPSPCSSPATSDYDTRGEAGPSQASSHPAASLFEVREDPAPSQPETYRFTFKSGTASSNPSGMSSGHHPGTSTQVPYPPCPSPPPEPTTSTTTGPQFHWTQGQSQPAPTPRPSTSSPTKDPRVRGTRKPRTVRNLPSRCFADSA